MDIFKKGSTWEATRVSDLEKSRRNQRFIIGLLSLCLVASTVALAMLTPLRRTVPYVVERDRATGTVEVLQAFDNRTVGTQEGLNRYWARRYVTAREQYNWYLVAQDYDAIATMTDPAIFKEYGDQFVGERGFDKVFGNFTERRIEIISVAASPTNPAQMVVRFERTTVSKGQVVEAPTRFVVNMAYRYASNPYVSEVELSRNPMGYQVFAYRRDVEVPTTEGSPATSAATKPGQGS
jgi:type IV secretion system protein VirB8